MAHLDRSRFVTIASGGTASDALDLNGYVPVGLWTASTMTGTALTFQAERQDNTYVTMEDGAGANISKTISGGEYIPLNPADFAGVTRIKVVSGSAEGAARTIYLSLRQIA